MGKRVATLPLGLGLLLVALAGCATSPSEGAGELVYEHRWSYGPGYGRTDPEGDPLFTDVFDSSVGGPWEATVTSRVEAGNYTVVLRGPGGTTRAVIREDGNQTLEGAIGVWQVEIFTDAAGDVVPQGHVELVVRTRP